MSLPKAALLCLFLLHPAFDGPLLAGDAVSGLETWLKSGSPDHGKLAGQPFAEVPLSKEQAGVAAGLLLAHFQERLRESRAGEWEAKSLQQGELTMRFEHRVFGDKPPGGRSLFISMHGGGGAPPQVNDQQWRNQIRLYEPEEGVYLAPRAPTDTWNLWHQGHIDGFFQRIIEDAIVFEQVDPNRVYIMGYSAGGDGVYQLAPRMADSLAAAAMMAGHPNDASPLGLRNIGFTLHMGGKDAAYNRNAVALQWKTMLEELQKEDPEGYRHEVVIHEPFGHWMNGEDRVAVPWMAKFTRDPNPSRIVWRQAGTTHGRFYWLAVAPDQQKGGSVVIAEREGSSVRIEKMENVRKVTVRLNDAMADLDEELTVVLPDGETRRFTPVRSIATLFKCLGERFDPAAVYSCEVEVQIE